MDAGQALMMMQGIQAANAAAAQADLQNKIAAEQLAWAKQQWADAKAQNQPIIDRLVRGMDFQDDYAREQKALYDTTYKPIEEDFARRAMAYDTPERREQEAGAAAADIAQQFEGARQASAQQLKDYGVDPSSARYQATDFASRIGQGAAAAGAMNMARRNVENTGFQLQGAAINTGRGYPGAINQTAGVGQNAGNSAVANTNNTLTTGSNAMMAPSAYYQNANQAIGMWNSGVNNTYGNYMEGYKFNNTPRSSGIGSALGLAAGIGTQAAMAGMFAEGGAVPEMASPSAGVETDDVPARVNVGEFIMPKEAVSWFGEKAMHDMILKAQKERAQIEQQSGAVPDVMPAIQQQPNLVSRARPAALPVG